MKTTIRNSEIELSQRDITGSLTGYPEPYIGQFFYGFNNIEEAKEYSTKVGGEVRKAEWKNGWNNCKLGGPAYEELTPSNDDYGDNYQVIDTILELKSEAYFMVNESIDEDEKKMWKNCGDNLMKNCENINWEKDSVVLENGDFLETVPKKSMVFHFDTRTIVIGVAVYK